jgi:HAD superfamily hydrolase (TIGR01509 family)
VRAVLFDFSGTLFRLEHDDSWLDGITDSDGRPLDGAAQDEIMCRMTTPVGASVKLSAEHQDAWDRRDLDPEMHRKSSLEVLRLSGITEVAQAEGLYGRLVDPYSWTPYPDTKAVLERLNSAGVPVAVVSNIPFDLRPALVNLGVADLIDEVFMSYVEGLIKPDPKLFLRACERLDTDPENVLMVGDSEEADGGAAEIGARVAIVDPLPTSQRPDALLSAVLDHDL